METARLGPGDGEWSGDPGDTAMEAGDTRPVCNVQDRSPPSAITESSGDPGPRSNERHGDPGPAANERTGDPGPAANERTGDPGPAANERTGDPGPATNEGNGDAGPGGNKGSGDPGSGGSERTGDTGSRISEGTGYSEPGANEGVREPGANEGVREPGANEGVREPGANEGARDPRSRCVERPEANDGAKHAGSRCIERLNSPGTSSDEGPGDYGFRDSGAGVHEGSGLPDSGSHEAPNSPRACPAKQRDARATERPHATCGERGSPTRISRNATAVVHGSPKEPTYAEPGSFEKSYSARTSTCRKLTASESQLNDGENVSRANAGHGPHNPRDSTNEGPINPRGSESFKKPTLPVRSSGNEKAMESRDKPSVSTSQSSSSVCSRATNWEAAADVCSRLPSDAYQTSPAIPYREPSWSGRPQTLYSLEILKAGSIVSTKSLNELSWIVIGRLPTCHIPLEHPSVSRYHAVLQYRQILGSEPDEECGFYVYDLGSTHGTYLNKQRIQPKTYCRFRVGHVLKFGGSTRLFILQGPEDDQEEESEMTVTQIKEARRQKEKLQKRMLGDDSDEEEDAEEGEKKNEPGSSGQDVGCMWGMGEDALEEESDENPIALDFQEEREALYLKNPKKTLQGFFDREGEELDYEYEERGISVWICRIKLPVDDSNGKQLVAEAVHTGKKKDSANMCALEACRILDMRGLLRQEAVSRKRKSKKWEEEDFYDSDDDTFLDRTGLVEKKRLTRMKKAGKIEEKPETYDSLVAKLNLVEKELAEIAGKLTASHTGGEQNSGQEDSLDAFMTEIKAGVSMDAVTRKKLHLNSCELKKEEQRLKSLIKMVQPTKLPELSPATQDSKSKKLTLPMFGAMKGGSKYKLKTGTVGKLPPKRTELPASLFTMKDENNLLEEEEDDDDMEVEPQKESQTSPAGHSDFMAASTGQPPSPNVAEPEEKLVFKGLTSDNLVSDPICDPRAVADDKSTESKEEERKAIDVPKRKKVLGPSRPPPGTCSSSYPEDDPDYSVWTPPAGQTGDGKTHLNQKYGY
ncbi:kanadaptin [Pelodytes ibericus]